MHHSNRFTELVTAATVLPITRDDLAKVHIRVEHADEDAYLDHLIHAATQEALNYTETAFLPTAYKDSYEIGFPCKTTENPRAAIEFWKTPVLTVDEIRVYAGEDYDQTIVIAPETYTVANAEGGNCSIVYPKKRRWEHELEGEEQLYVEIDYTAGYADAASVPEDIKHAILLIVGDMYERREDYVRMLPTASRMILKKYKMY